MAMIHVKPAEGRRIRNPDRSFRVMPDAGEEVADSIHWRRALAAGDIVLVEPPAAAPAASKTRPAKS